MNLKIYVAYHKESDRLQDNIYTPIQVGRGVSDTVLENMIGDNTGDNISHKNKLYCETTATYWAWKNSQADYIGICHYRRYLSFYGPSLITRLRRKKKFCSYIYEWICKSVHQIRQGWDSLKTVGSVGEMHAIAIHFSSNVENYMQKNNLDIIAVKPLHYNTSVFIAYASYHIDILRRIIWESYREYYQTFESYGKRNKFIPGNMVVMKREKYNEYASFLFGVLERHERMCLEEGWCIDPYNEKSHARISGYLAEILTAVFVRYNKKKHKNTKYVYFVSNQLE